MVGYNINKWVSSHVVCSSRYFIAAITSGLLSGAGRRHCLPTSSAETMRLVKMAVLHIVMPCGACTQLIRVII